jgi:methanethiol S-methyltransferase
VNVATLYLVGLLSFVLFGVTHSVFAQEWFKAWVARWTSQFYVDHFYRLTYNAISWVILNYMVIASLNAADRAAPWMVISWPDWIQPSRPYVFIFGVLIVYAAFLQFDYLEFLGLKQAWRGILKLAKRPIDPMPPPLVGVGVLRAHGIYYFVRHPMLSGGMIMVLVTGSFSKIALSLAYTIIGAHYEERRLARNLGPAFLKYKSEVGAYVPRLACIATFFTSGRATRDFQ